MVVRARRTHVERHGGSGHGFVAAAAFFCWGWRRRGWCDGRGDAGLVDAVSADATQNPMSRRRNEHVLNYEEEMNEWQLPANCCPSQMSAEESFNGLQTLHGITQAWQYRLRRRHPHNA